MTRPGDRSVLFDTNTWKLGTRGLGGSFQNQRPYIENMRLYHDGSLGPRPGWRKPVVNSGTGTYYTSAFGAQQITQPGVARASYLSTPNSGWTIIPGPSTAFNPRFEYISGGGTLIYLFGSTFGQSLGPHAWIDRIGDYAYLLSGIYVSASVASPFFTLSSGNAAIETLFSGALTYQPAGSAYHNARGFYWGTMLDGSNIGSLENRMYYSDINAPTTFTSATQSFDMEWPIAGAVSLGSVLLIWSPSGQWAALQGGRDTPANGTIVPLGRGKIPSRGRQPAVFDGTLVFLSSDLMSLVTVNEGGQVDDLTLGYLGQQTYPENYQTGTRPATPAVSSVYNTILVPYSGASPYAYHNQRGVWTQEYTSISLGSDPVVRFDDAKGEEQLLVWDGAKWVFYYRPVGINPQGPTPLYDEISGPSDFRETLTCKLYLPRISEPGRQVRFTRAVVTGRYWGSDLYDAPDWDPTLVLATRSPIGLTAGPTTPFGLTSAVGTAFRADLRPDSAVPMDAWFELDLAAMKSVGIETVLIEYEVSDQESW